jgi:hypothetical protein
MVVSDKPEAESMDSSRVDNELQAFVASTLMAIMNAVTEVQKDARAKSAHGSGEYGFSPPEQVAFDIAVNAKRTGTKKGGFKVEVFSVGANAGADASTENSTVSRIQFTIPAKFKSTKSGGNKSARSAKAGWRDKKTEE